MPKAPRRRKVKGALALSPWKSGRDLTPEQLRGRVLRGAATKAQKNVRMPKIEMKEPGW